MIKRNKKTSKVKKIPKKAKSSHPKTEGVIHIHSKGFGFVSPKDSKKYPQDIFVPKHLKANAVDGDTVEVAVYPEKRSEKGPEGYVLKVIERAKQEIVGTVWMINPKGNYLLYVPSLGQAKSAFVHKKKGISYQIGDRLLLFVQDWGEESDVAICKVIEKIGNIDHPASDIPAAIKDFQIRDAFPKDVIKEAKSYGHKVGKSDLEGRTDLTDLECFTIDPETAKDFDDALSLTKDEQGYYHLGVHIADVSHYVTPGSALDKEARSRSNSTYFPNQCVPMLPEDLSNNLCSLREQVLRLTVSVLIKLDKKGTVLGSQILRGFIKSRKRFTYQEAKEVIDGKKKSPYKQSLHLMKELCYLLKQKRTERGSVDLALPEIVILVDKKGQPYDYAVHEYDITHQLVEEYMLKANEIVASHFVDRNIPAVFRIHDTPSAENLEDFYALARSLGFKLPDKPSCEDVQKLFDLAKNTPHSHQLSIAFIRSMKLAIYSKENVGHYGLALENYCHFTSPIRRYSDLIIHRLLFEKSFPENLDLISRECSENERRSFKAEVSVINLKKLRLLQVYQQSDPKRVYSATISKIKHFGIFFEISPISIEGFIHVSELHKDYYEYNQKIQGLVGQNTGHRFIVGEKIEVLLEEIDLIVIESKWKILRKRKGKKK